MLTTEYPAQCACFTAALLLLFILCQGRPAFSRNKTADPRAITAAKRNHDSKAISERFNTRSGTGLTREAAWGPKSKEFFGKEITTEVTGEKFCAGDPIDLTFTVTVQIQFQLGNSFIAQLSDQSGKFNNAITIGDLTGFSSGTIRARIPPDTPGGSGYRIRVISIFPVVTGDDNGKDLTILPSPAVNVSVSGPTTFCTGGSVTLTASSPENNYLWSNGATTPSITVKESGNYTVSVAGANGCSRTLNPITVVVNTALTPPTIDVFGPLSVCEGYRTEVNVPFFEGVKYQWKKNGKDIGVSGNALGIFEAGEYFVTLTNDCGTVASDTVLISLKASVPPPVALPASLCGPSSVTLRASGGEEGKYQWYDNNNNPVPGATGSSFTTPPVSANTTFYVSNTLYGCESKKVPVTVTVRPAPPVNAGPDEIIEEGESVQLQGSGGTLFQWSPTAGMSSVRAAAPVVSPDKTTTYTLTAIDPNGCEASDEVTVIVRKKLIIPNAFSPNNDGVNDTWEITHIESRQEVKMEVFNRWGIKVYESAGYGQPWDGTASGRELPIGTYFYVITSEGGRQKLTGSVSIIR